MSLHPCFCSPAGSAAPPSAPPLPSVFFPFPFSLARLHAAPTDDRIQCIPPGMIPHLGCRGEGLPRPISATPPQTLTLSTGAAARHAPPTTELPKQNEPPQLRTPPRHPLSATSPFMQNTIYKFPFICRCRKQTQRTVLVLLTEERRPPPGERSHNVFSTQGGQLAGWAPGLASPPPRPPLLRLLPLPPAA